MSKVINFPKKDHKHKPHIFNTDYCAGCENEMTEDNTSKMIQLPYENHVEIIGLCNDCAGVAKDHGVNI